MMSSSIEYARHPLDLEKLAASGAPDAPGWVIENWLARRQLALLSSRRGIGASLLAHQIGYAVSLCAEFIAPVPKPLTVLVWDSESSRNELERCYLALNRHFGKTYNVQHLATSHLIVEPLAEQECALLDVAFSKPLRTPVFEEFCQQVGDYRADLVILIGIDRFFGGNLGDPHHRAEFISMVKFGLSPTGAAGILVDQWSAQNRQQSGAVRNAVPTWGELCHAQLHFTSKIPDGLADKLPDDRDEGEPQTDLRYLLKRRDSWAPHDVCSMFVDDGAYNISPYREIDPSMRFAHRQAVTIEGFKKFRPLNIDPTAGEKSPDYLPKRIMEYSFNDGLKKEAIAEMMRWLIGRGVFKIEPVGQYKGNRCKRDILVLYEDVL